MSDAVDDAALAAASACRTNGDLGGAVRALKRALKSAPEQARLWNELGLAQEDNNQASDAAVSYRRALALQPRSADFANNLGNALRALDESQAALQAYREAAEFAPSAPQAHTNIGDVLQAGGEIEQAVKAYHAALDVDPRYIPARYLLACVELMRGRPEVALEHAQRCLDVDPFAPDVLALKVIVLRELGRDGEAKVLCDVERFVHEVMLSPPPGYGHIRRFNRALEAYILERSNLTRDPYKASTRGGRHSDDLMLNPTGPALELRHMLQQAFGEYAQSLPRDADHPFLSRPIDRVQLVAQANILDSGGFLIPHVHPHAWVSGAYYLRIPKEIKSDGGSRAGWIRFGGASDEIRPVREPEFHYVRPREGMLLLFPSYFYHATVPFSAKKHRMSLGVDVIAA
ncbi:MAG: tetratricopeptide repeat protein [Gammaproteobacteria bacterium]|nr:tetratricopeptide repeat protein [Gammaproteobacteria bacterium]